MFEIHRAAFLSMLQLARFRKAGISSLRLCVLCVLERFKKYCSDLLKDEDEDDELARRHLPPLVPGAATSEGEGESPMVTH